MTATNDISSQEDFTVLKELEKQIGKSIPRIESEDYNNIEFYFDKIGFSTKNGRIVRLGLAKQNLTNITSSICHLSELSQLLLNYNQLKSLPESFGHLGKLKLLILSENQITSLPESFGNLISLERLFIAGNNISGLPTTFGNLPLKEIDLSRNSLSKLPKSFGELNNLQKLWFYNTQFAALPEFFGSLTSLKYLNLAYNPLKKLPKSFSKLKNLQELSLEKTLVSNLQPLLSLSSLKVVTLADRAKIDLTKIEGEKNMIQRQQALERFSSHLFSSDDNKGPIDGIMVIIRDNVPSLIVPSINMPFQRDYQFFSEIMKIARLVGKPEGETISGYAYHINYENLKLLANDPQFEEHVPSGLIKILRPTDKIYFYFDYIAYEEPPFLTPPSLALIKRAINASKKEMKHAKEDFG